MSDLIDRQAAIDRIEHESREWGDEYGISDVLCDLSDMPSACKTVIDAVSKADVLEAYSDLYIVFDDCPGIIEELHKEYDELNKLPSVKPARKPGKWIEHNPHKWGLGIVFECSECGETIECEPSNFCPNCGADMRGEE